MSALKVLTFRNEQQFELHRLCRPSAASTSSLSCSTINPVVRKIAQQHPRPVRCAVSSPPAHKQSSFTYPEQLPVPLSQISPTQRPPTSLICTTVLDVVQHSVCSLHAPSTSSPIMLSTTSPPVLPLHKWSHLYAVSLTNHCDRVSLHSQSPPLTNKSLRMYFPLFPASTLISQITTFDVPAKRPLCLFVYCNAL